MKALSLWQPWATLIVIGAKRIETRGWATSHRGPLLIHASKHTGRDEIEICHDEPFRSALRGAGIGRWQDLPRGGVIGIAELADCIEIPAGTECPGKLLGDGVLVRGVKLPPDGDECDFGNFLPGRFAWVLRNARGLADFVPYRGAQGLFEVAPQEVGFA